MTYESLMTKIEHASAKGCDSFFLGVLVAMRFPNLAGKIRDNGQLHSFIGGFNASDMLSGIRAQLACANEPVHEESLQEAEAIFDKDHSPERNDK